MPGSWAGGTGIAMGVKGVAPCEAQPGFQDQLSVSGMSLTQAFLSFVSYLSSSQLFSLFANALYSLIVEFLRNKL